MPTLSRPCTRGTKPMDPVAPSPGTNPISLRARRPDRGTNPTPNPHIPAQHNGTKPCLSNQHYAYKERSHYTTPSPQEQERTQWPSHPQPSLHGTNPMITTSSSLCTWNEAMTILSAPPLARNEPILTLATLPYSRNEPTTLHAGTSPFLPLKKSKIGIAILCLAQPTRSPPARNEPNRLNILTLFAWNEAMPTLSARPLSRNEAMHRFHPVSTGGVHLHGTNPSLLVESIEQQDPPAASSAGNCGHLRPLRFNMPRSRNEAIRCPTTFARHAPCHLPVGVHGYRTRPAIRCTLRTVDRALARVTVGRQE